MRSSRSILMGLFYGSLHEGSKETKRQELTVNYCILFPLTSLYSNTQNICKSFLGPFVQALISRFKELPLLLAALAGSINFLICPLKHCRIRLYRTTSVMPDFFKMNSTILVRTGLSSTSCNLQIEGC